jgi:hypothetical protein
VIVVWVVVAWLILVPLFTMLYHRAQRRALAAPLPPPPPPPVFGTGFPVLDGGQTPFWQVAASCEPFRFKPYEHWRAEYERTGDPEALQQMIRYVEDK